jgi:hypothetical protein
VPHEQRGAQQGAAKCEESPFSGLERLEGGLE